MDTDVSDRTQLALRVLALHGEYQSIQDDAALSVQFGLAGPRTAEEIAAEYADALTSLVAHS